MRSRSNVILNAKWGNSNVGVFYYPTKSESFSARRQTDLVAIFDSLVVDGTSSLMRWSTISWSSTLETGCSVSACVRFSSSKSSLETATWEGPYLNGISEDISSHVERYLQVRLVLTGTGWPDNNGSTPMISSLSVQGIQYGNEEKLYTKAFNLGFVPKYFLITYNGKIPEDTVLRFAIAGENTIVTKNYMAVTPNRIQSLEDLPDITGKIKLMVSALGSNIHPFEISKIAVMVSGDGEARLNREETNLPDIWVIGAGRIGSVIVD